MSSLNEHLIGIKSGRTKLATPALILDLDVFEANVAAMAAHCRKNGLLLRPHAKTHKSADIARRQIAAGAVGICCAKLSEAEALGGEGIESILLTSPVVTDEGIERLMRLNAAMGELMAVVDDVEVARRVAAAADEAGKPMHLIIDIDVGLHRTGTTLEKGALELGKFIAASSSLVFRGLQAYAGHVMHIKAFEERQTTSLDCMKRLDETRAALEEEGIAVEILSGGGTGTFDIDPVANVLTELQGGSYIFMDRQYNDVDVIGERLFGTALFVDTTVISATVPGLVTTDAGFKSFASDADTPQIVSGAPEGADYFFFGDEQGGVFVPEQGTLPLGTRLSCIQPHCDPTVNLYDHYHCVRGDELVEIWPVTARGRSQ